MPPGTDSSAGMETPAQPQPGPNQGVVQTLVDAQGLPQTAFAATRDALIVSSAASTSNVLAERMGQRDRMHNPGDLIELARYVEQADSHTKAIAGGKLELISDQIKALQAQARKVLEDARRDVELSHAKCNFQRRPGRTYHLYKKKPGDREKVTNLPNHPADTLQGEEVFFSMLSPNEWGGNPPHEYLDSYRLEYDMSWTPVERIKQRDQSRNFNATMLGLTEGHVDVGGTQLQLTLS